MRSQRKERSLQARVLRDSSVEDEGLGMRSALEQTVAQRCAFPEEQGGRAACVGQPGEEGADT